MTSRNLDRQDGFTLIELLVVILIIGILAAIALPQFLEQGKKAEDAEAKSLARNLLTHVEACFAEEKDWASCDTGAEVPKTGLKWATGTPQSGEVQVLLRPYGQDVVAFTATSKTGTVFALTHGTDDRTMGRVCFVPSNAYPTGACRRGGPFGAMGFGTW